MIKKTNYDTKISKIEKKCTDHNHDRDFIRSELDNLAAGVFNARLAQANVMTKTDFKLSSLNRKDKLLSLNRKITSNNTKHLVAKNEFKKEKTFDSRCFIVKSQFEEDSTQSYLVF